MKGALWNAKLKWTSHVGKEPYENILRRIEPYKMLKTRKEPPPPPPPKKKKKKKKNAKKKSSDRRRPS